MQQRPPGSSPRAPLRRRACPRCRIRAGSAALLVATLLIAGLSTGCRTLHATDTTPGIYEPLFEREQVRTNLAAARGEAAQYDGVQRSLARAAVDLWSALDVLYGQLPLPEEMGRAREAAALADYLRRVGRAARSAPPERPLEFHPPAVELHVELGVEDFVATAEEAAAAGRYEDAIIAAEGLLDDLEPDAEGGSLAAELRYRSGLWHLAQGRFEDARASFSAVLETPTRMANVTDRARLMSEEIDLLLMLPETPQREQLARGWALLETGDEAGAAAIASQVAAGGGDAEAAREAEFLASAVERTRAQRWGGLEASGRADVADGPPFDIARTSAAALAEQGGDTRSDALLGAIATAEAALAALAAAEAEESWVGAMAESQALIASERFREAAAVFDRFAGTDLEERAQEAAAGALNIHVREERKRAGDLFVAAQRTADPDQRRTLLESARAILAALAADFPGSEYADRVQRNLTAVEQALAELPAPATAP